MSWHGIWPVVDGHADTLAVLCEQGRKLGQLSEKGHLDLPRLKRAGIDLQVLALCAQERPNAKRWAKDIITSFAKEMKTFEEEAVWLCSAKDWERWEEGGSVGFLLALEGLEPLEGQPEALFELYDLGIRMATLTWNHSNPFAAGINGSGGLTSKGRDVIEIMGELQIVLDLSHLHYDGFQEICRKPPQCPILVSHANCTAIHKHPRNLDDDQIRFVSELGGTVGLALFPPFLGEEDQVSLSDAYRHIDHLMQIGGTECPALGCDLDGILVTPLGIEDVTDLPALFTGIDSLYHSDMATRQIIGGNLLGVLRKTVGSNFLSHQTKPDRPAFD
jgi:membrane dipeptidase